MLTAAASVSVTAPSSNAPHPGPLPPGGGRESAAPVLQPLAPRSGEREGPTPEAWEGKGRTWSEAAFCAEPAGVGGRDPKPGYFAGFSSFQGSLTCGLVAISTLASLPSIFSARRI